MCYRPAGVRAPNVIIKQRKATPSELAQALGTSFTLDESQAVAGSKLQATNPTDSSAGEVQAKVLHIH